MKWFLNLFKSKPVPPKPERVVKYKVVQKPIEIDVKRIDVTIKLKGKTIKITKIGTLYSGYAVTVSLVTGHPISSFRYQTEEKDDPTAEVNYGLPNAQLPNAGDFSGDSGWVLYTNKKGDTVQVPREQVRSVTISEPYDAGDVVKATVHVLEGIEK